MAITEQEREINDPRWRAFIEFCRKLGHGDIERLKVHDGVPVLVETTTIIQKTKFV